MKLYEKFPVILANSLSGTKEILTPVHEGNIGMYVCGPTVYSNVHLGNVRTFMAFDVIARYLRHVGYAVRYVRNITDVGHLEHDGDDAEDKISKKAIAEKLEPMEVVKSYTDDFQQTMRIFNILSPNIEPSATGHIIEQVTLIKKLLDAGLAYSSNGSVYFNVAKYHETHNYGILSGRVIEQLMESGRSLDSQDDKNEKIDFSLWKKASSRHIMRWPSPWGEGFPGWHAECTAMSIKYLGEQFDIHGGGIDLKFPHHECEIAQAIGATGTMPAKYWLHTNMLTINGQKMSKSLDNSILPSELVAGTHDLIDTPYHPMEIRFFMLQSHYSSTLDMSNDALKAAKKGYKKLSQALKTSAQLVPSTNGSVDGRLKRNLLQLVDEVYQNMSDDFNTAKTLSTLFEMASRINDFKSGKISMNAVDKSTLNTFRETYCSIMQNVLGLLPIASQDDGRLHNILNILVDIRKRAKRDRNFVLSDHIRFELNHIGVKMNDGKDGDVDYVID